MCTRNELDRLLQILADSSKQTFGDMLMGVVLFGSYARNDFNDESDVDIAFLLNVPKGQELGYKEAVLSLLAKLDDLSGYSIFLSPTIISYPFFEEWKDTMPFYRNIEAEGVRIVA